MHISVLNACSFPRFLVLILQAKFAIFSVLLLVCCEYFNYVSFLPHCPLILVFPSLDCKLPGLRDRFCAIIAESTNRTSIVPWTENFTRKDFIFNIFQERREVSKQSSRKKQEHC